MHSTHNEGKSVVGERFIRALKNEIYNLMRTTSKNEYINKLDKIIDKYKNMCQRTIKMKPVDVNPGTYIDYGLSIVTKILNSKLVIMREYQNTKTVLQRATFRIGLCD